jgi:hypothetical protein
MKAPPALLVFVVMMSPSLRVRRVLRRHFARPAVRGLLVCTLAEHGSLTVCAG